jgi:hypothetical protein
VAKRQGYKIVTADRDGTKWSSHFGRHYFLEGAGPKKYIPGEWTTRGNAKEYGPLAVFTNKKDADIFGEKTQRAWDSDFELWECEYTTSVIKTCFFKMKKMIFKMPQGGTTANRVMLTHYVKRYPPFWKRT